MSIINVQTPGPDCVVIAADFLQALDLALKK